MSAPRSLPVLLVTILVLCSGSESAPHEEANIVGGHIVKEGEIPYQVSLRSYSSFTYSHGHFCGGTIIDKRHVVTAAHCARKITNINDFYVAVGSRDLASRKVKKYKLSKVQIHDEFSYADLRNDIALIKLKKNLRFNKFVKAKKIARKEPKEGTKCIISGWGSWKYGEQFVHPEMRAAVVYISNMKECVANYSAGQVDPETMICAGINGGGTDSCQGDSGGPMICKGQLAGVVSWGHGCAFPNFPGIYTNAANYVSWLKKHGVKVKEVEKNSDKEEDENDDDDDENEDEDEEDEHEEEEEEEEEQNSEEILPAVEMRHIVEQFIPETSEQS